MTTVLLALGGVAAFPIAEASATPDPAAAATEFFGRLNQTRADNARAALSRDAGLDALALAWSTHMADVFDATGVVYTPGITDCSKVALCHRPDLTHGLDVIEPNWRGGAENIGVGGDVQSLHDAFVHSAGHFANMIGDYNRVGVAVVVRGDRMWVTFDFMLGPPNPTVPAASSATRLSSPPATGAVVAIGGQTTFVPVDPVRHLVVSRLAGRDEEERRVRAIGEAEGKLGLAAARASEQHDEAHRTASSAAGSERLSGSARTAMRT